MITTPANRQFAHLPRHGLKTESVPSMKPEEKNKTDLPTQLKVANRSGLEAETLSRGLRLAAGGAKRPPRGFQRAQPLAYLCLLSLREKVGRGAGRSACRWVLGLPAPQKPPGRGAERPHGGCRGCQPCINSRGMGRSALPMGAWGVQPLPLRGVGAKSHNLLPRGSAPRIGPQRPSRKGDKKKDASIAGSALLLWETGN